MTILSTFPKRVLGIINEALGDLPKELLTGGIGAVVVTFFSITFAASGLVGGVVVFLLLFFIASIISIFLPPPTNERKSLLAPPKPGSPKSRSRLILGIGVILCIALICGFGGYLIARSNHVPQTIQRVIVIPIFIFLNVPPPPPIGIASSTPTSLPINPTQPPSSGVPTVPPTLLPGQPTYTPTSKPTPTFTPIPKPTPTYTPTPKPTPTFTPIPKPPAFYVETIYTQNGKPTAGGPSPLIGGGEFCQISPSRYYVTTIYNQGQQTLNWAANQTDSSGKSVTINPGPSAGSIQGGSSTVFNFTWAAGSLIFSSNGGNFTMTLDCG